MKKLRSAVKVHGGKFYLIDFITAHFPDDYRKLTYLEPYGGGGSVILNKNPSVNDIYNDNDIKLALAFYCLKNNPDYIIKRISEIEYSEESFKWAINFPKAPHSDLPKLDPELAVSEIVARRMSRGGLKNHFCWSERLRGGRPGEINSWENFKLETPKISERLQKIDVQCQQAFDIIEAVADDPNVVIYCDPPYLPSTRNSKDVYESEMSEADHVSLSNLLHKVKGKVVLSGYYSQLYVKLYTGWTMVVKEVPNHSSQQKQKQRRLECLWSNYAEFAEQTA